VLDAARRGQYTRAVPARPVPARAPDTGPRPTGRRVERLGYRPAFDGLRAVAVVPVLLFHASVSWARGGFLGVDIFFVLSGFLITRLLLEERELTGRIALGGEAGNTHYDAVSHCILVAVQTKNELVAIDPASDRIVARYAMSCDHPHGFLIDGPNRLAFVTCEGDAKLLVVDLRTMRVTATLRTADDPDVLALDPVLQRLYVGCESGAVSIFEERFAEGRGTLASLGEYRAPHAHSVSVDPATHRVYVPLQDIDGKPTLRILEPPS